VTLRKTTTGWLLSLALALTAWGALPVVLQPNATAYSTTELADLNAAIGSLQTLLPDPTLGSQKSLGEYRWTTSLEFAAYTAGILSGRGYETRLVAQAGWPDGRHVWILVGVPLSSGRTAWVPVEATPRAGERQYRLGSIPLHTGAGGQPEFDGAYARFTDEISLPTNSLPIAQIGFSPSKGVANGAITFLTAGSRDPDGEIVRYTWLFGDGGTAEGQTASHAYTQAGSYKVSLRVADSRGATAVMEVRIEVAASSQDPPPPTPATPGGGCGCGK